MIILNEDPQIASLNEMFMTAQESLPKNIESSIYYPKLKTLLHPEILSFCKEQIELKADLNFLRMEVGNTLSESEIREYLDSLKLKYNDKDDSNICLDYHIEVTRVDYGVPVFVVIKRGNNIIMKKFCFRFRKKSVSDSLSGLTISGIPLDTLKNNGGE